MGTAPIVDNHLLLQRLPHRRRKNSWRHVSGTSGGEPHQHPNRFGGIDLAVPDGRRTHDGYTEQSPHYPSPHRAVLLCNRLAICRELPILPLIAANDRKFNGHEVGRDTIANVLNYNGIEPAPQRSKRTKWPTFLKAHWKMFAVGDSLPAEMWMGSNALDRRPKLRQAFEACCKYKATLVIAKLDRLARNVPLR